MSPLHGPLDPAGKVTALPFTADDDGHDSMSKMTRITTLAHVAIKAADLAATVAFYEAVLGLRQVPRPPFGFPGAWLGTDDGAALIHLYGGERARATDGDVAMGTGAIDHVSLWAHGYAAQRERLVRYDLPFRESLVPDSTLAQLFVFDPNGVLLELTYDRRDESDFSPGSAGAALQFDPARYTKFAPPVRT